MKIMIPSRTTSFIFTSVLEIYILLYKYQTYYMFDGEGVRMISVTGGDGSPTLDFGGEAVA